MTQTPTAPQNEPQHGSVDIQAVLDAYATELATVTQRAILAEASLRQHAIALAEARATISALSPGAPDLPDEEQQP